MTTRTKDNTAPKLVSTAPITGSLKVNVNQNIVLTFDEKIKLSAGNVVLKNGSDVRKIALDDATQISVIGKKLIINPSENLLEGKNYSVSFSNGAITDVTGNKFAGFTSKNALSFTTKDIHKPLLLSSSPAMDSQKIKVSQNVVLTFNEEIQAGKGSIVLKSGGDIRRISITDSSQVKISGSKITINPTKDFIEGREYSLTMPSTVIKDLSGNAFKGLNAATTIKFNTLDKTSPEFNKVAFSANALPDAEKNIVLTFNEAIQAGSGNIYLRNGTHRLVISVKDNSQVTIKNNTLVLNPAEDLQENTQYTLYFAKGVIKDLAGNAFAGFAQKEGLQIAIGASSSNPLVITSDNHEDHDTTSPVAEAPPAGNGHDDHDHSEMSDSNAEIIVTDEHVHSHAQNVLTGKAIDGYLSGATVFADANGDGVFNEGEATAQTDGSGNFSLTDASGAIVVSGGTDLTTGEAFNGILKAPAGSTTVTPLTTLAQGFIDAGKTPQEANELIAKVLGVENTTIDFSHYDPISQIVTGATDNAAQLMAQAAQIANFLVMTTQILQNVAGSENANVASDAILRTLIQTLESNPDKPLDLTDASFIRTVLVEGAKEFAQSVSNTDVTEKVSLLADTVTTVLQESAQAISQAVSQNTNATDLLTQIGKVSAFTQQDATTKLNEVAKTLDTKDENTLTKLQDVTKSLSGEEAQKAIESKTVTPLAGFENTTAHDHGATSTTEDAATDDAHNHGATSTTGDAATGDAHNHGATSTTGDAATDDAHNHGTTSTTGDAATDDAHNHGATSTTGDAATDDAHNHGTTATTGGTATDDGHDHGSTSTGGTTTGGTTEHNHDTNNDEHDNHETMAITATISNIVHASRIGSSLAAQISAGGGHSHSSTTTTTPQPATTPDSTPTPQAGFTIMLDHPAPAGGLKINYVLDGSATLNTDYTVTAGENVSALSKRSFVIAAGQTSAVLNINPNPNVLHDNETIGLHLLSGQGYETQAGVSTFALDEAQTFATGRKPSAVATADFNSDGKLDLVVTNTANNTVSVLLRNASNTGFSTKTDLATGTLPVDVVTGDFNGDGKMDFATVNANSNSLSVFSRNAANTGFDKTDYATGTLPNVIVSADINGDGKLDFVVSNGAANTISVLLQKADGSGFDKTDYQTSNAPESVAVADFNGDGKADFVVVGSTGANVFMQTTDGFTSQNYQTGRGASAVMATDFNGDGKIDFAVANTQSNSISLFFNNGQGGFEPKMDYRTAEKPTALQSGDLNGDGKTDLAVLNQNASVVSLFMRNSENTDFGAKLAYRVFAGDSANIENYPNALALADIDSDGMLDVLVANQQASTVTVLENSSDSILMLSPIYALVSSTPMVEEGNAASFMITLDAPAPAGGLKMNFSLSGSATLIDDYTIEAGENLTLDNDGSFTIAAGQSSAMLTINTINDMQFIDDKETITLTLTDGAGYRAIQPSSFIEMENQNTHLNFAAWETHSADFNGDGLADLVIANAEMGKIDMLLRKTDNTGFETPVSFSENTDSLTTGDFNSDGKADFAFVNTANNSVSVYLRNTDNTGFTAKTVYQTGFAPLKIAAGDFNGDGFVDLATANRNGMVSVLLNSNNTGFATPENYQTGNSGSVSSISVGEFNGDYKDDIAVSYFEAHTVSVLVRNQANTGFNTRVNYQTQSSPHSAIGDLNGDGNADLIIANGDSNSISVLLRNQANTGFENSVDYEVGLYPTDVHVADFNGDGKMDLAVLNSGDDSVSLLFGSIEHAGFEEALNFKIDGSVTSSIVGDFNGDGRMDLAVGDTENKMPLLWNDESFITVHDHFIMMTGMMNSGTGMGGMDMGTGTGGMNMGGSTGGMTGMGGMSGMNMGGMGGMMM